MEAYTYFTVEEGIPSSSTDDTYTVKIRIDNRIEEREDRINEAILTCNCKGWTRRNIDPRSCRHTKERSSQLERFKKENEKRMRNGATLWVPSSGMGSASPVEEAEHSVEVLMRSLEDGVAFPDWIATIWQFGMEERALLMTAKMQKRLKEMLETTEAVTQLLGVG